MAESPNGRVASSRGITGRPLLEGGESLTIEVERGGGGAEKYHPHTVEETQARLAPQVGELRRRVREMPSTLRGRSVVFQAKLWPNYLAGSYYPHELLRSMGLEQVGSRRAVGVHITRTRESEQATRVLLLAGKDDSFERLETLLASEPTRHGQRVWDNLVRFDEIRLPDASEVVRQPLPATGDGELVSWEAVLHPVAGRVAGQRERDAADVFDKWVAHVRALSGSVDPDHRRETGGLTVVPIGLTVDALEELAAFNPLRYIRVMPRLRPIRQPVVVDFAPGQTVLRADRAAQPMSDVRVAVFDGGIDPTCTVLSPFVTTTDLTSAPSTPEDVLHGSVVTSALLFGYVEPGTRLPAPAVHVDHYRVLPVPAHVRADVAEVDRAAHWLLDEIERVVRANDYTIVSLSVAPDVPIDESEEPDPWTSRLDELAREKRVLFVTAAGNQGDLNRRRGFHRVQIPADMGNGLGVGASTGRAPRPIVRASYSSQGPGRWGARVQPAGLAFGGEATAPFVGLAPHGRLVGVLGTSFSAPLAAHGLAGLAATLGRERAAPETLRAFACHFAERRARGHDLDEVGFGRLLEHYDNALSCAPHEVTVLYEDVLRRDRVAGYSLPVPRDLPPSESLELWWTLCFTSPVDPTAAADYTLAGCDVTFRPDVRVYSFRDPRTNELLGDVNVVTQKAEVEALLSRGAVPSRMPKPHAARRVLRNEQGLRDAGKWETTVQHRFARRQAGTLFDPQIELSYLVRSAGGALVPAAEVEELPFTLLVTVRARPGTSLYEAVRRQSEFRTLVPLHTEIPLQTESPIEV